MWFSHLKDLFITNPRWQCWFTSSSITPLIAKCGWWNSLRFLVSVNAKLFKALNIISHWIDQLSKDWRSEFILVADTAGLESTISMRQASSVYNLIAYAKFITMSSKCTRKSKGPKIDPCGTPASTGRVSEWWPSSTTHCTRWWRYDEIHLSKFPEIPLRFSLNRTLLCHTLSNAFDKSRKTILTSLPSSKASVNLCVMDNSWETVPEWKTELCGFNNLFFIRKYILL